MAAAAAKSLQSRPTLCDPIDGSPPGSSVHGVLQVRILEWVAISFSPKLATNPQKASARPGLSGGQPTALAVPTLPLLFALNKLTPPERLCVWKFSSNARSDGLNSLLSCKLGMCDKMIPEVPFKTQSGDFPGIPVVRTPRLHCREHGFKPWSEN